MPTRNVVLTDQQAALVERLVATGRYQNASEVLRDGLRMIESRAAEEKARLQALRDAARSGLEDIEAGRVTALLSGDELRCHLAGLSRQSRARGDDPAPR
jgi:antitoxin ParD1/3/4